MSDKTPSNWQEIAGHKRELFNIVVQFTNDNECLDVMGKINDVIESMCDERIKSKITPIDVDSIIEKVSSINAYKVVGKRDSYSQYNQGWEDACDALGEEIKKELTNE